MAKNKQDALWIAGEYINPSFAAALVSGPPASGKSTLINRLCKKHYPEHSSATVLKKYTTRSQRAEEFDEFIFCTPEKFEQHNKIIFPYLRFGYLYGFCGEHLFELANSDMFMFCVSSDFETTKKIKRFLETKGAKVKAIFLYARWHDLLKRISHRNMPEKDLEIRIASIKEDLGYFRKNKASFNKVYDHILNNSNTRTIDDVANQVFKLISQH